ncbi:MAG: phosphoribosylaminoimidazolesuccinocarboxamide synthase [Alphaproteobacteria bacterium]|nr:phosphoribosylaminoimidazolesuccinocarboxamide synthase [Alphaproteobacteria bacterium]
MISVVEGKTKIIKPVPDDENLVHLITKDNLSAGDLAKQAFIDGIGKSKTSQAANAFSYLNRKGVPTAFIEKIEDNVLLCEACDMIPIEFVVRRYAWGSHFKRNPEDQRADGKPPRFDEPKWELYHKDAVISSKATEKPCQMSEGAAREIYLKDGVWTAGIYTDPYVDINGKDGKWDLYSAKDPLKDAEPMLSINPVLSDEGLKEAIENIVLPTFKALEEAWAKVETADGPVHLADAKFELGYRTRDGKIVLADVVDNDCWRIWPGGDPTKQLDKQSFREGHTLEEVDEKYDLVSRLTSQF